MTAQLYSDFQTLRAQPLSSNVVEIRLDLPGKGANVLTAQMLSDLNDCCEQLRQRGSLQAVIITSAKPSIFVAGADLNYIRDHLDDDADEVQRFCRHGQEILGQLSRLPCVTIAAIAGTCVGGGLELALACDFRWCADHPRIRLGLPEVNLGLIPGWGGTVRLPRLIGVQAAAELITSGRLIGVDEAHKLGLVDQVIGGDQLVKAAANWIEQPGTLEAWQARRQQQSSDLAQPTAGTSGGPVDAQARDAFIAAIERRHPQVHRLAPRIALEQVWKTHQLPLEAAMQGEAEAMAKVWGGPASRGLLNAFFLTDWIKKSPGLTADPAERQPIEITTVGIVGVGQMGEQIARATHRNGYRVVLYDADSRKSAQLTSALTDPHEGNAPNDPAVRAATEMKQLGDCQLIVECVVENPGVKRSVLTQISQYAGADCLIATNTSMISLAQLVSAIDRPQRFIGMHFCHPIERRMVVEVVRGKDTAAPSIIAAVEFLRKLGRRPMVVGDAPGFVVNRLLTPLLDEAVNVAERGISVVEIDQSAQKFGFVDPPFRFIDAIGVDTAFHSGLSTLATLPHCVTLNPILPRMVKLGRLGQKSGRGFYRYDPSGNPGEDPAWAAEVGVQPVAADAAYENAQTEFSIGERLAAVMAREAFALLETDVVRDHRDIDFCSIEGCGFPAHTGGVLFWAQQIGLDRLVQMLQSISRTRPSMTVPPLLQRWADEGHRIY